MNPGAQLSLSEDGPGDGHAVLRLDDFNPPLPPPREPTITGVAQLEFRATPGAVAQAGQKRSAFNITLPPFLRQRRVWWLGASLGTIVAFMVVIGLGYDTDIVAWAEKFMQKQETGISVPILAEISTNDVPATEPPAPLFSKAMIGNPYWALPNTLDPHPTPMGRIWSRGLDDTWRPLLNHKFVYQHFQAVQFLRQNRFTNAEGILYDALADSQFWTRMEALCALAEFGYFVDIPTVERAFGNARPDLIHNYLRRFERRASPGEIYIMRQAIRVVDARGRQLILSILAKRRQSIDRLYLAAAAFDPSQTVSTWFQREEIYTFVPSAIMAEYKALIVSDWLGAQKNIEPQPHPVESASPQVDESPAVAELSYFSELMPSLSSPEPSSSPLPIEDGLDNLGAVQMELPPSPLPPPLSKP